MASKVTGESLYEECLRLKNGSGVSRGWDIKHFQIIADNLKSNEEVLVPFMGLNDYSSATEHDGTFAFAVTDKRIIMGQKKVIGQNVKTVSLARVSDITLAERGTVTILEIDTLGDRIRIGTTARTGRSVYKSVLEILNQRGSEIMSSGKKQTPVKKKKATSEAKTAVEQVKELKELLDMGILTQEEFDTKKKQLLGL